MSAIDILKLDIQGGELMALRGAMRLLEAGNVSLIYTELCSYLTMMGNLSSTRFGRFWSNSGTRYLIFIIP